ncbi:MAG: 3'-5' exonuclease [Acidobacteria bacterium]|nr:3'-5' exonuclease [Acidobacteriota bacterium]
MNLRRYKNLVPDSPLHRQLESLLLANGGRVSAATVCEEVLLLSGTDSSLAKVLVQGLIEDDPRLRVSDGGVEWVEPRHETWRACRCFVVVDVETTNGGRGEQHIMEIGVCRVEDGRLEREWSSLVNPGRPIPYWVQQLTGITDATVRTAPPFEEIVPRLLEELEEAILVGHHARFDIGCLNAEFGRLLGKRLGNPYLCTAELARRFLPGSENYRLQTLSQWLRLTHERPHRAGSDARATAELFCHLLARGELPWGDYLRPRVSPPPGQKISETNSPAFS